LHATVAENLRYGNHSCSDADVQAAAALAEAHEFIKGLPSGYDTVIGGRGYALSDGQRQRIGVARLILQNPSVVVLDEAFSALDPVTEKKVRRNLFRHFSGRAFLVISHRLHGLADFERLYLMEKGQLREVDSRELIARLGGDSNRLGVSTVGTVGKFGDPIGKRLCIG
jgi:ABC-type multidrug transport system fused ATPase/permease subunit